MLVAIFPAAWGFHASGLGLSGCAPSCRGCLCLPCATQFLSPTFPSSMPLSHYLLLTLGGFKAEFKMSHFEALQRSCDLKSMQPDLLVQYNFTFWSSCKGSFPWIDENVGGDEDLLSNYYVPGTVWNPLETECWDV